MKCGGASDLLCESDANGMVVVFHCVHGSPAPAGRKKRSIGPKVAVTSDVNMPASMYSCFRSLMSSVALCAGSSTSAPSCDVSVDSIRSLPSER